MNLLRKACLRLIAHNLRSCCVKGVTWLFMSALEQPCADDFLTSIGSATVNPSELQMWTAHMAANQGCSVSASIEDKFFLSEKSWFELAFDCLEQSSVSASLDRWAAQPLLKQSVQRKAGCLGTDRWSDIKYLCDALRVPMCYTDVLCLHLKCPQEGGQDCVAPVRIIDHPRGLAWLQ